MKQHAPHFLSLVTEAKKQINEITPQELKTWLDSQKQFDLIDVREESERSSGHISTSMHLSKGVIERDIEKKHS